MAEVRTEPPHVATMTPFERAVRDAMMAVGLGDYGIVARHVARELRKGGYGDCHQVLDELREKVARETWASARRDPNDFLTIRALEWAISLIDSIRDADTPRED